MGARLRMVLLVFPGLFATPGFAAGDGPPAQVEAAGEFAATVLPLVRRVCLECHSTEEQEGEVDLERFTRSEHLRAAPEVWERVLRQVERGEMPPRESPQPTAEERARFEGWVRHFLADEATRRAGDPGRVVLRRLNNAQYAYTLRDLTGIADLDPAREFPVDGAAGEGFTNTGQALVMSPSLVTKYLDAAKAVADHAVLLPDGFRFTTGTTARDRTEETLAEIRRFYGEFTAPGQGTAVNLQGIAFETNGGGRLPLDRYLAATILDRAGLTAGTTTIAAAANRRGLNARYLGRLWEALTSPVPSVLIRDIQARWRPARVEDVPALVAEVAAWQQSLFQFSSVGHIGKVGGPAAWMEPVNPLVATQDIRFKIPPAPDNQGVTVSMVASAAGGDPAVVLWRQPRIVAPGRPDIPLRDLRRVAAELELRRRDVLEATTRSLDAAAEAAASPGRKDVATLARERGLDPDALRAWFDILGIIPADPRIVLGHFTQPLTNGGGHPFIAGWSRGGLPQLLTNSSDQAVRIPGRMKPHGVAVHPSTTFRAVVGWQSPVAGTVGVGGSVQHAHPECGNGVTWWLDRRRGSTRTRLASGVAQGDPVVPIGPIGEVDVRPGDLVSLGIGPRDGNQGCDLTAIDLTIREPGDSGRTWDLAADVAGDVLAGNPHADRLGHPAVWHFYDEPDAPVESTPMLPPGSILARWQAAPTPQDRHHLAAELERLLTAADPPAGAGPDATLVRLLRSANGPLLGPIGRARPLGAAEPGATGALATAGEWGLDPKSFGSHPGGPARDPASLCVAVPAVVSFRIPADLAAGAELVTSGVLDGPPDAEGSAQLAAVAGPPPPSNGLQPSDPTMVLGGATWTSTTRQTSFAAPILVNAGTASRRRIEAALDDFRALFPAALCYARIVPVDEVVTLTLFHREDEPLRRLMLDDAQRARLDRLWDELHFLSRDALTLVDAYAQLMEYASQDGDPRVFEPLRRPILDRAAAFRRRLVEAEPGQVDALIAFAARAYRRPLSGPESDQLRGFYGRVRAAGMDHDEAFRLTLARLLVAPGFLYRLEQPVEGAEPGPVTDHELATRLSYFLWSSTPDPELRALADSGRLAAPGVLVEQSHRLLRDDRARRLAIEFACHWLQIADFEGLDEKSERHFPTFLALRGAMFEESVRFLTDLFQHDGSILSLLDADHTFVNGPLAEHYGVPLDPAVGAGWRRVDGIKQYGRGGILGQATTLARQSGASRTSPTLRGNWVSEVLLGERLPRPPKGVAQLPDDEGATAGRTVRQLVEQHASDAKCAGCHSRIDPLGFALERFDAIGRRRDKDLGERAIDTRARAPDGAEFDGLAGLQAYLLTARREAFVRQFCRKLLGFALGRATQLADAALLAEMKAALETHDYRVGVAIDRIVQSRQFGAIRGRATADTD